MEIGKQNGFTLIELMITVAVVAILSALAYPSFQGAMMKNRRAAAQAYLSDVAQKQQQYLMDARAYTDSTTALKVVQPADVTRFYDLTITVALSTTPSFTATATPKVGGVQVKDGPLSITQDGTKLPDGKW